jgi:hypothetical protein
MLVCPRCHRSNPPEAVFCHHDGAELRPVHGEPSGHNRLPQDLVFPSGRRCRTYDELALACLEEWATARDLLERGVFQAFLANGGRLDLARVAEEAAALPDRDIGLDTFLHELPTTIDLPKPEPDLNPRRLLLGTVRVGECPEVSLVISNRGQGLLHGTLSITEGGSWLRFADNQGNGPCLIKTRDEQAIVLQVESRGLAAPQSYLAKLTVITNGGIVEVPVLLDVAAYPFPRAPFQGAASPRDLAERMRARPKAAVPLLESGELARWFSVNGWIYPIEGSSAPGVAGIQQFFEAMGLAKPPVVRLEEASARFLCVYPEVVAGRIVLRTASRKWIYARAESDVHWVRIPAPVASGPRLAVIEYEVDSSLLEPGRSHEGTIQITANSGQKLFVRISCVVRRPEQPFTRRLLGPFFTGGLAGLL